MCSVVEVFDAIHSRLFWIQLMIDKHNYSITLHLQLTTIDDQKGKCIIHRQRAVVPSSSPKNFTVR